MKKLVLEVNNNIDDKTSVTKLGNKICLSTPPIDQDYWKYRVKLFKD